uniref:FLYWCH-type domain-containing protein n=1 Tax=Cacopsylla melanoneura TaxID=428564 RepID=A0A8D9ELP3_9HEMI
MNRLTFIDSEKEGSLLVFQKHKFYRSRQLLIGEYKWRCYKKLCPAFVKIIPPDTITENSTSHNHPTVDDKVLLQQKMSGLAKRKATGNRNHVYSSFKNHERLYQINPI